MYNLHESISLLICLKPHDIIIRILSSSHSPLWYAPSSAFSELIALKSIGETVEKGIGEAGSLAGSSPFLTCN
jgi:hypothetical protein